MLSFKRIVVDSRYGTPHDEENWGNEFTYTLPETVNLPRGSTCLVSMVSIPHGQVNNVSTGHDIVYVQEQRTHVNSAGSTIQEAPVLTAVELPHANYKASTLASELAAALNDGTALTRQAGHSWQGGSYFVQFDGVSAYTVEPDSGGADHDGVL